MNRGEIYSVSYVNQYIKNMFSEEYALSVIFVKGEVSNCKYHSSGHIYFTLKDRGSQLTCVMFRGDRKGLPFLMEDGMEVVVGGSISVYERDGKYQLYAKRIKKAGAGELAEEFEKRKKKLSEAGYFDPDRKLPLPSYAGTVGVVTARTGAAIQDIINVTARRNPYVQLVLYPAKVQGEGAAESIARGIETLAEHPVDVIIAGRGGGSIEDLWAFNEEVVADAIYRSRVPVISAVGHETDFTIADFVADMRAPTPSAAAELAVYDVRQHFQALEEKRQRLMAAIEYKVALSRQRLKEMEKRVSYFNPEKSLNDKRQLLVSWEEKMTALMEKRLMKERHRLEVLAGRVDGGSPLKRLSAGYGFVADEDKQPVSQAASLKEGQKLSVTLQDGVVTSTVERIDLWN